MDQLKKTERTEVTRMANRASYDKETIKAILAEGLVCHVSYVFEGQPFTIPHLYGVKEETIYIHGSVGSFMLRELKKEIDLCFSVTLIDGLVLARSAFHHSVNYRSVILFGKAKLVEEEEEKTAALKVLTEHVIKGRWDDVRKPNATEMKQTMVLAISLEQASAKIRTGGPNDDEEDYALDVWAGVLPLTLVAGSAIPDIKMKEEREVPEYVIGYDRKL
ncbi:MAG: pyridoxamine 5'-phosphate oxidase family protein [Cytophagales bacterium]|nr:pyridoxamine 5'-phosphate oxidase family protein [Cytophaga sp.]